LNDLQLADKAVTLALLHLVNEHPNLKETPEQSTIVIATRKNPKETSDNNWVDRYRLEVQNGKVRLTFLETRDLPADQRDASFRELVRCALKISENNMAKAYLVFGEKRTVFWDQFKWANAKMDDKPGSKADSATMTWNGGVADGWEFDDQRLIVRSEAFNANEKKTWVRADGKPKMWKAPDDSLDLWIELPTNRRQIVLKGKELKTRHQDKKLEFSCRLEPGVEFPAATVEPRQKSNSKSDNGP